MVSTTSSMKLNRVVVLVVVLGLVGDQRFMVVAFVVGLGAYLGVGFSVVNGFLVVTGFCHWGRAVVGFGAGFVYRLAPNRDCQLPIPGFLAPTEEAGPIIDSREKF